MMINKNFFWIVFLFCLALTAQNSLAAGIGGLNYNSENTTFYADRSAPSLTITAPTGNINTLSSTLTTTASDVSSMTCNYNITDSNLNQEVAHTSYDCASAAFTVSADGNYIAFATVTDGTYTTIKNSSFTVDSSSIASGGGAGGGGKTLVVVGSANTTAVLDFGRSILSITVIAPPSTTTKDIKIQNIGNEKMEEYNIWLSDSISHFLVVNFCDIDKINCDDKLNLEPGESGLLSITGDFPANFGSGKQGILRVFKEGTSIAEGQNFELPVSLDRLPLYKLIDGGVNFISSLTGLNKDLSLAILFALFVGLLIGATSLLLKN